MYVDDIADSNKIIHMNEIIKEKSLEIIKKFKNDIYDEVHE